MVPGAGKPVNLAHSGKPHGLFHGEGVVVIEPWVVGVGPWYHGVPIQVWMYVGIGLCSMKVTTHGSQLALQVEGVCNGHYNRTPDLGKGGKWWNVWDLARYSILDAKVLDCNVTWLTKHKDTS